MGDHAESGREPRHPRLVRLLLVLSPPIAVLALAVALSSAVDRGGGAADLRTASGIGAVRPIDRPAPGFRLPALSGHGSLSLAGYRGNLVVLNFWASWCRPCRQEAPVLERLWTAYRGLGVRFVGIDHRDDRRDALAFQREFGHHLPERI